MGHTIVFMGAGASRPFGVPLTAEILPEILRRLGLGTLFGRTRSARRTGRKLQDLLHAFAPGLGQPRIQPPLITDVLSLIDHMSANGQAVRPSLGPRELDSLRALLEQGLAEVLAARRTPRRSNPALLKRFVDWTLALAQAEGLTLISTNYDVVVEESLYARLDRDHLAREVDFGVGWYGLGEDEVHPRPAQPRLGLLKLHGSLDWLRCPRCEHLFIQPARSVFGTDRHASAPRRAACTCGYRALRHVLVAPSMVRDVRDGSLLAIWQAALDALRRASRWFIIGYSMPPEDVAIRSMFLRALGGRHAAPEIVLVQRKDAGGVRDRYRLLAPQLKFLSGGLAQLMRNV
jgi:hypothetical protein